MDIIKSSLKIVKSDMFYKRGNVSREAYVCFYGLTPYLTVWLCWQAHLDLSPKAPYSCVIVGTSQDLPETQVLHLSNGSCEDFLSSVCQVCNVMPGT